MNAFEKYYDEDVVMIMEDGSEVEGKDTSREREKEFFGSVEEFHGSKVIEHFLERRHGYYIR